MPEVSSCASESHQVPLSETTRCPISSQPRLNWVVKVTSIVTWSDWSAGPCDAAYAVLQILPQGL